MIARIATTCATLLLATGCWSSPDGDPAASTTGQGEATYAEAPCPKRVAASVVGSVECAYLTVPQTRSDVGDPAGSPAVRSAVRVFITRIAPPEGSPPHEPIVVTNNNTGTAPNYGGISPLAQRLRREVIIVSPRGVGYSEPSLECPEVEALNTRFLATSGDAMTRRALLRRITTCRDRLAVMGVDVTAYTTSDMAADLHALRRALGIETWNVFAYGTGSRSALELIEQDPGAVRSVMLDSPEAPGQSTAQLAARTPQIVRHVLGICANDPACERRHPSPRRLLAQAERSVVEQPLVLTGRDLAGEQRRVHLDRQMLWRVLRQIMSDGGSSSQVFTASALPGLLTAVRDRRTAELSAKVASIVVREQPLCMGSHPQCALPHDIALGALLSATCSSADHRAPAIDAPGPSRRGTSTPSPYSPWDIEAACRRWGVHPDERSVHDTERHEIPSFVVAGALSTYTLADQLGGALPLADPYVVVDPLGGHNVVGRTECLLELRQAWFDSLTPAPPPPCLAAPTFTWEF